MSFLSRDFITGQLVRAFGLKTFQTDLSPTVIPVIPALDLERSPWPPSWQWSVTGVIGGGGAGNFSIVGVRMDPAAPKEARATIDGFSVLVTDATGLLRFGVGTDADFAAVGGLTAQFPVRRFTAEPTETPTASSVTPVIAELGLVTKNNNNTNLVGSNAALLITSASVTAFPRQALGYPIAVLRPGYIAALETNTANISLTAHIYGRYFIGQ